MPGSAPQARGWLLLQHPGPWPVDAIAGAGIDPPLLAALTEAASRAEVRILLVRRPGRPGLDEARRWMLTGPGLGALEGPWADDRDLPAAVEALGRAVDGTAAHSDESATRQFPGGHPPSPPREVHILVCAHGVHDTCCAIRGRPVAAALAEHWPDQVWECSHVGGDRFAPNVVVVPDGFYYGNLEPASAVEVVRRHLAGEVDATWLRGMASYPPPVQAAVVAAYERLGPLPPGAVRVLRVDRAGPHEFNSSAVAGGPGSLTTVELIVAGAPERRLRIEIESIRRPPAKLTCRAIRETPATEYRKATVVVLPPTRAPES
jgi:(2Fe-2S) ferredoxin